MILAQTIEAPPANPPVKSSIVITKVTDGQTGVLSLAGTCVLGNGEKVVYVGVVVFDANDFAIGKTQTATNGGGVWNCEYKVTADSYVRAIVTLTTDLDNVEDNKTPGDFVKGATKWVVK